METRLGLKRWGSTHRPANFREVRWNVSPGEPGLRPTAKAVDMPPDPTVGAPALYPSKGALLFGNASDNTEGRGVLTMASISLQDLRRRLYVKAKADKDWRFWGLYVHVAKLETLRAAYDLAKRNNGAPGIDGVTFDAIEAAGVDAFLAQLRDELVTRTYRSLRNRRVEIPKDAGKRVRILRVPTVTANCGTVQYAFGVRRCDASLPPLGRPAAPDSLRASSSSRSPVCLRGGPARDCRAA